MAKAPKTAIGVLRRTLKGSDQLSYKAPQIIEAHFAGHRLREYLFESGHSLAGTVAGSGRTIDLRRTVLIEAHGELRARTRFKSRESRKRHHLAFIVPYVELADVLRPGSIVAFGFDVNLPLPPEPVEIVDE